MGQKFGRDLSSKKRKKFGKEAGTQKTDINSEKQVCQSETILYATLYISTGHCVVSPYDASLSTAPFHFTV